MTVIREVRDTAAAPDVVWEVLVDVEQWPRWTASMDSIERQDSGSLRVGSTAVVHQPKGTPTVWRVTALERARQFTWQTHAPGITMVADHVLTPVDGVTRIDLTLTHHGPLTWLATVLVGRRMRRYVQMEADGLQRTAEGEGAR